MKKNIKGLTFLSIVFLFSTLGWACFPFKSSINLNDYIVIETEGYNTLGKAKVEFDLDKFETENAKKIKMDSSMTMQQSLYNATQPELLKILYIDYSVNGNNNLSNGDVITIKWKCDDSSAEQFFGCKLKYSDIEYSVTGLEEVKTFDPFENVTLIYSGIEPNGVVDEIKVDYSKPEMQYLTFKADKGYNLSSGDEVCVSAEMIGTINEYVNNFNCIPSIYEKKYIVSSLPKYISDVNEIPDNVIDQMDIQLRDHMKAKFAEWENENLESMDLIGEYLIAAKPGFEVTDNNMLTMVYRIKGNNPNGTFEYIWTGFYVDLIEDASGEIEFDLSKITYPKENKDSKYLIYLPENQDKYRYYGFIDIDSFYEAIITQNMEKYTYTYKVK